METEFDVFYCVSAGDYGQRLNQDLPHNIQMQSVSIAVHFEPHNHQHSSKRAPDVERTRRQTSWVVAKTRTYGYYIIASAGHPSTIRTNDWSTGSPNSRYKWLRGKGVVNTFGCTAFHTICLSSRLLFYSLRSRRLEEVGTRKNGRVRRPHVTPRVSPSRAPIRSFTHYFQAPTTQASDNLPMVYRELHSGKVPGSISEAAPDNLNAPKYHTSRCFIYTTQIAYGTVFFNRFWCLEKGAD